MARVSTRCREAATNLTGKPGPERVAVGKAVC